MSEKFEVNAKFIIAVAYQGKPLTMEQKNEIAFLVERDLNDMSAIKLCPIDKKQDEGYRVYIRVHMKEVV